MVSGFDVAKNMRAATKHEHAAVATDSKRSKKIVNVKMSIRPLTHIVLLHTAIVPLHRLLLVGYLLAFPC